MSSEIRKLGDSAKTALEPVADWLRAADAPFYTLGDYDVCSGNEKLAELSLKFVQEFAKDFQFASGPKSRITAMRFNSQAILPVGDKTTVILIPVGTISGTPAIGKGDTRQDVQGGDFVCLKEDTFMEPSFCALLLLVSE